MDAEEDEEEVEDEEVFYSEGKGKQEEEEDEALSLEGKGKEEEEEDEGLESTRTGWRLQRADRSATRQVRTRHLPPLLEPLLAPPLAPLLAPHLAEPARNPLMSPITVGMGADALPTPTLEQLEAVRKQQLELASLHAQMEPVLAMTLYAAPRPEAGRESRTMGVGGRPNPATCRPVRAQPAGGQRGGDGAAV